MGPEKNFEQKVKTFVESQGGWCVKFFANAFTKAGVPDLLCCVNGYFVAVEVKAENGKPSPLQIKNVDMIREANGFAFVLYPSGFEEFKLFVKCLNKDSYTKDMPVELKGGKK